MNEELNILRLSARKFLQKEFTPYLESWIEQKYVDKAAWLKAGSAGLLCASIPDQYGGGGGTIAHETVILEELEGCGVGVNFGNTIHSGIVAHYILAYGSEDQRQRWLPQMASGELIGALAMTEPGAGSDLQNIRMRAARNESGYLLNGQKTFITNGHMAGIIVVAAKVNLDAGAKGISLFVVETENCDGFRRGRNLRKIGMHASDTAELFFDNVYVPADNILGGKEGVGFSQMMAQLPIERLLIAISAVAAIERAVEITREYVKEREAFGKRLLDFQNTGFKLAERATEATIARVFIDYCIERAIAGDLDAVTASMAKWWLTDKQSETADVCLQMFGGYGYMEEYPISQMYVDSRVQRIYGGTNEIMKMLIARHL
ncbi:MAG: acyl-CoA dehydrogenase [Candidatus Marinimicrobia bacterium]|nr:acyl-CoA dehydrogenase [Candidatus Neomarinimicrobiota bacterium]